LDNFVKTKEGLLVYTVDMTIGQLGGGYVTIRRPDSASKVFLDAALQQGDSVTIDGVTITVTKSGLSSDSISVSRK
jgi:riboflavin synthase alpha subunit